MATRNLVFEIGTEELPAFDLHAATIQLEKLLANEKDRAFEYEKAEVFTTPRRIICLFEGVPESIPEKTEEYRGPSCKIAFDENGEPTNAARGFAKGKGVDVSELVRREEADGEYVYAIKTTPEQAVADLLPDYLSSLITTISWPKSQRWGSFDEVFSRPVRWLLALFGNEVIPLTYAGLESGRTTIAHRFLAPEPIEIATADDLLPTLRANYVVPSEAEREASIREQVAAIEAATGMTSDLPAHTMQEVVNLCEYPTVMVGEFDESFLAVPKEITVDAMLVHQRYFPLFNADGSLANRFLITSNGDPAFEANIVDGNQRVVAARLYDAKFFYDEDLKKPLEAYVDKLSTVVFQEQLGTTLQKTNRITALARDFAGTLGLSKQERADAQRAAYLCKADLVSGAVVEFTSVQGIMGSYYAKASGETDAVAQAIADHYRPRFSGDELPASDVGKVVATADKIDTICGLFAVDQAPTGSSDPFALRRSAIGILAMLESGMDIPLEHMIDASLALFEQDGLEFDAAAIKDQVIDFFVTRTRVALKDRGFSQDSIDAVLSIDVKEPLVIISRVAALEKARAESPETFEDLAIAYARANNLRTPESGTDVDASLFNAEEQALSSAIDEARESIADSLAQGDYASALASLSSLRAPIDAFFESTMVMDEDEKLRENRLKLLNSFISVFTDVADFGKMAKTAK